MPWSGATGSLSSGGGGGATGRGRHISLTPFLFGHVDFALSLTNPDGGTGRAAAWLIRAVRAQAIQELNPSWI